jgi:hypothetical protein
MFIIDTKHATELTNARPENPNYVDLKGKKARLLQQHLQEERASYNKSIHALRPSH